MKRTVSILLTVLMVFSCTMFSYAATEKQSVFDVEPSGFRVITVGTGNPNLDINRGGNSTLVQYKDKYFLVDCGTGAVNTLMKKGLSIGKINNMLFTHQHNDHNADFWTYFVGGWGTFDGRRSLNLVGPGTQKLYDLTVDIYKTDLEYRSSGVGFPPDGVLKNVNITDFNKQKAYEITLDGVKIKAIPVPHTIETFAYRFEAGGQSVVISGDFTYTDALAPFAKDADIFVVDAMMTSDFMDVPAQARDGMKKNLLRSHVSSDELGKIAAQSNAKQLVLTHLGGEVDLEKVTEKYRKLGYQGKVILAKDGMVIRP